MRRSSGATRGWRWSIPRGYGAALAGGQAQAVQIVADGSDANSAGVSLWYATNLVATYGQETARNARLSRPVEATCRWPASSRVCASGSTRGSRAATS